MLEFLDRLYSSRGVYDYTDLGARKILANYIGVEPKICERICISHGIDFGHLETPQDINLPHPIHWSYNNNIYSRVSARKVSFKMAHPWLLLKHNYQPRRNSVLVLGPTPGPRNNATVESKIRELGIKNFDILLKQRGDIENDIKFWENRNIGVVTAGESDENFLMRLSVIMSRYETLIACNLSSAIVFASVLGLRVKLIECSLYHYETLDFAKSVTLGGTLNKFGRIVFNGEPNDVKFFSLNLLGKNLLCSPEEGYNLLRQVNNLANEKPIYVNHHLRYHKLRIAAALISKRKGFLSEALSVRRVFNQLMKRPRYVSSIMTNDVNIAFNGLNANNFKLSVKRYKKDLTEPGMGQ